MIRLMLAIALAVLVVAPSHADALTERLRFWDEGPNDPSFVKFRDELKAVIARKDARTLSAMLAPDVRIDFGDAGSRAKFQEMWKPGDKDSQVWAALSLVVEQGGNFDSKTRFSAPYVYSAWPSDLDPFDKVVVTSEAAVMRAKPAANAPVVRSLDRDILTVIDGMKVQHEAGPDDWTHVKDARGNQGFVLAREVRSPIDYRAIFERRNGRWLIAIFVAGD